MCRFGLDTDPMSMSLVERARQTMRNRTAFYAVGFGSLALFLVTGFVFANTVSVSRIADDAVALHWNVSAAGTAAVTKAEVVHAVTFAKLEDERFVTTAEFDFILQEAVDALGEIQSLKATANDDRLSFAPLARFEGEVIAVLDALSDGNPERARVMVAEGLEPAYDELAAALDTEQAQIQAAIEESSAAGRSLNAWATFLLIVAVPGTAVAVSMVVARRQIRSAGQDHHLELEAEREVNRAKDDFIAGLSHELRTPLTSIYGFAEILSDGDVQGPEAIRETAGIIANQAAEMTRMVDDLMTASRLAGTGLEIQLLPVTVSDIVESAVEPFERAGFLITRERGSLQALADGARLRQVLVNLLSNAVGHADPQTSVEVTATDQVVDIEVAHNEPVANEEELSAFFEKLAGEDEQPLFTASTWLGLGIAARVTMLMGGTLRYQRYQGRTYFVVSLPAASFIDEPARNEESVADMIRVLSS